MKNRAKKILIGLFTLISAATVAQTPSTPPVVTTKELFWGKTESLLGQQVTLEGKVNFQTMQTPADCGLDKDSCACNNSMGVLYLDSIRLEGACRGDRCSMMCSPLNPRNPNSVRVTGTLKLQSTTDATPRLILESLEAQSAQQQIGGQWHPLPTGQFKVFLNNAAAPPEAIPVKSAPFPAPNPAANLVPSLTVKDLIWGRADSLNNQRIVLEGRKLNWIAEPLVSSCYRQYCGCSGVQGNLYLDGIQIAASCTGDNCNQTCTPLDPTNPNPVRLLGTLKVIAPEADMTTDEPPTLSLTDLDPKALQQFVNGEWVNLPAKPAKVKHQILPTKAEWAKQNTPAQ